MPAMTSAASPRATGAVRVVILFLLVFAGAFATQLEAADDFAADGISQDEAVMLVRQHTKGKVIRVERDVDGVTVYYRVRVLTPDGRLRDYHVDAVTGTIR